MSDDFCLVHGRDHMRRVPGNPIPVCDACMVDEPTDYMKRAAATHQRMVKSSSSPTPEQKEIARLQSELSKSQADRARMEEALLQRVQRDNGCRDNGGMKRQLPCGSWGAEKCGCALEALADVTALTTEQAEEKE